MRLNKLALLSGAAPIALAFGLAAPAQAFDEVNWSWDKTVTETIEKNVTVTTDIVPSGMIELEKLQINVGNVSASSTVSGIENNQPDVEGTATVDETFSATLDYDGNSNEITAGSFTGGDDLSVVLAPDPNGNIDENANEIVFDFNVSGEVQVDAGPSFDAETELPSVESAATAVANNQSIVGDVPVELHDGQFAYGGYDTDAGFGWEGLVTAWIIDGVYDAGLNTNLALGAGFLAGGATGVITPASITANSSVSDILNASVDSAATAVANNTSVSVDTNTADNGFVLADMTQMAYANSSATSNVSGVTLNNYTNLAAVSPIVSSSATAVGNNVSISVSSVGPLNP